MKKLSALEKISIRRKILYIKRGILNMFKNCASNRDWNAVTASYTAHWIRQFLEQIENIEYTIIQGPKKFTVDVFVVDSSGLVVNIHVEPNF